MVTGMAELYGSYKGNRQGCGVEPAPLRWGGVSGAYKHLRVVSPGRPATPAGRCGTLEPLPSEGQVMDIPQERRLVTEIPGPRSRALLERRLAAVPRGVFYTTPLFVEAASG